MQIKENFDAFEDLVPPITELNKSYRENLAEGRLIPVSYTHLTLPTKA